MRNRHYMFTNKSYAVGGIISSIMAILAVGCFLFGIMQSFERRGNGGEMVGLLGTLSLIFAIVGAVLGIRSFKEEDKFYNFSWFGSIINCVMALGMILIIAYTVI